MVCRLPAEGCLFRWGVGCPIGRGVLDRTARRTRQWTEVARPVRDYWTFDSIVNRLGRLVTANLLAGPGQLHEVKTENALAQPINDVLWVEPRQAHNISTL